MAQIKNINKYPYDVSITGNEYVIGTDTDSNNKTMNYRLSNLAAYFSQYFTSQNQDVSLSGDITGGNGITIIPTTASPSLISNKPDADSFEEGGKLLYLEGGVLKKIDAQVIIDINGGPTYTPITLVGSGLEFVQTLTTNTSGAIIAASISTIQDSTTLQKGVLRIATPSEYNSSSTSIAIPPAALSTFVPNSAINGVLNFIPKFTNTSTLGSSVMRETTGGNIGVGMNPSEKFGVSGYIEATGYKNAQNSDAVVFTTNGGYAAGTEDVKISGGHIRLFPLNISIGNGSYTIPETEYKRVYVSYEGTNISGTDQITLPSLREGQEITIVRTILSGGTMNILGPSITLELESKVGYRFYCNGHNWLCLGQFDVTVM